MFFSCYIEPRFRGAKGTGLIAIFKHPLTWLFRKREVHVGKQLQALDLNRKHGNWTMSLPQTFSISTSFEECGRRS